MANERPHFRKAARQLSRFDSPQSDFTEPWRVHQEPTGIEWQHDCGDGGVLAPSNPGADLADAKLETGLHRVQQAGFSGARRAGHYRGSSLERGRELRNALTGLGAGGEHWIAGRLAPLDQIAAGIEDRKSTRLN